MPTPYLSVEQGDGSHLWAIGYSKSMLYYIVGTKRKYMLIDMGLTLGFVSAQVFDGLIVKMQMFEPSA